MPELSADHVVIACASDSMYVRPLAAMLRSVMDNLAPHRSATIYVFQSGISEADQQALTFGWPDDRFSVHWIAADEAAFSGLPLWGRMPVATYFKLGLPSLLPDSVERVLWLDCDMIVLEDVSELWSVNLHGASLGAVQDAIVPLVSSRCGIEHHGELGIDGATKYFNAGVMLVDVTAWRDADVQKKAVEYLRCYTDSVVFWDQEGLNAALAGEWFEIDTRWNQNVSLPGSRQDSTRGPGIVHFAGSLKPWRYRTNDPVRRLYYDYLDRTAFAGWRPPASLAGSVVSFYEESGLRALMYPVENLGMRLIRGVSRR